MPYLSCLNSFLFNQVTYREVFLFLAKISDDVSLFSLKRHKLEGS